MLETRVGVYQPPVRCSRARGLAMETALTSARLSRRSLPTESHRICPQRQESGFRGAKSSGTGSGQLNATFGGCECACS